MDYSLKRASNNFKCILILDVTVGCCTSIVKLKCISKNAIEEPSKTTQRKDGMSRR